MFIIYHFYITRVSKTYFFRNNILRLYYFSELCRLYRDHKWKLISNRKYHGVTGIFFVFNCSWFSCSKSGRWCFDVRPIKCISDDVHRRTLVIFFIALRPPCPNSRVFIVPCLLFSKWSTIGLLTYASSAIT